MLAGLCWKLAATNKVTARNTGIAGQHGQDHDLQHRERLQPPGAMVGHLGDDMLGAEVLRGGAARAGRRAPGDLGHATPLPRQQDTHSPCAPGHPMNRDRSPMWLGTLGCGEYARRGAP